MFINQAPSFTLIPPSFAGRSKRNPAIITTGIKTLTKDAGEALLEHGLVLGEKPNFQFKPKIQLFIHPDFNHPTAALADTIEHFKESKKKGSMSPQIIHNLNTPNDIESYPIIGRKKQTPAYLAVFYPEAIGYPPISNQDVYTLLKESGITVPEAADFLKKHNLT